MAAEADPEDLASPTLAQVLDTALEGALANVHTCSWGYVTSYDAATQRATVQVAPRRMWTDDEGTRRTERPAPLLNVPVIFPGSGPYSITWNIANGDWVLLLFAETAMDSWHEGGQTDVDSGDRRRHSLSDAVAIPGLRPRTAPVAGPPPSDAMCLTAAKLLLGSKNASQAVVVQSALDYFQAQLIFAISTQSTNPPGLAALTALYQALYGGTTVPTPPTGAGNGTGWSAGTTKAKAE